MSKRWVVGFFVAALLGGSMVYASSGNEPAFGNHEQMLGTQSSQQAATEILQSHCGGGGSYGLGGGGWGHGWGHGATAVIRHFILACSLQIWYSDERFHG